MNATDHPRSEPCTGPRQRGNRGRPNASDFLGASAAELMLMALSEGVLAGLSP